MKNKKLGIITGMLILGSLFPIDAIHANMGIVFEEQAQSFIRGYFNNNSKNQFDTFELFNSDFSDLPENVTIQPIIYQNYTIDGLRDLFELGYRHDITLHIDIFLTTRRQDISLTITINNKIFDLFHIFGFCVSWKNATHLRFRIVSEMYKETNILGYYERTLLEMDSWAGNNSSYECNFSIENHDNSSYRFSGTCVILKERMVGGGDRGDIIDTTNWLYWLFHTGGGIATYSCTSGTILTLMIIAILNWGDWKEKNKNKWRNKND